MYKLNELNNNLNDMDKYIDTKTINLQFQLMNNYLDELNRLLIKNNYDFRYSKEELVNHIDIFQIDDRDDILYNLGGVLNHINYFNSISSNSKNVPTGKISNAINNKYKTFSNFKNIFINTANKLVGSGYTHLVIDKNHNLNIINTSNEDTPYSYGLIPIITLDLWEHAYFLKYNLNKTQYIKDFFNILDFDKINKNYENIVSNMK